MKSKFCGFEGSHFFEGKEHEIPLQKFRSDTQHNFRIWLGKRSL